MSRGARHLRGSLAALLKYIATCPPAVGRSGTVKYSQCPRPAHNSDAGRAGSASPGEPCTAANAAIFKRLQVFSVACMGSEGPHFTPQFSHSSLLHMQSLSLLYITARTNLRCVVRAADAEVIEVG